MSHALYHAISSAKHFGGVPEDYIHLHEWLNHTKHHFTDARHRLVLHNSWGISLAEQIFGSTITRNSDGKCIPVRPILEQHIVEDIGRIPSLEQCLSQVSLKPWMYRNTEKKPCSGEVIET